MNEFKKQTKEFFKYALTLLKQSLPSLLMYISAGGVLMMLTLKQDALAWDNSKLTWTLVCALVAVGYNLMVSIAQGTEGYDMLVTGNVQRYSFEVVEGGYKMSKYKPEKEYRVWKGFVVGGIIALFTIISAILMGANQASIDSGVVTKGNSAIVLVCAILSGWCALPMYYLNVSGYAISYFWMLPCALLPVVVSGVGYIIGAYRKRAKELKKQALKDSEEQARANKTKKVNYGALPGTKPRKRK
jgi:hypothetical protein